MKPPEYIMPEIVAALKGDSEIQELCGGRVYPIKAPQGVALPLIVYQRISATPQMTLTGYSEEDVIVQINQFSLVFADALTLTQAVRRAMANSGLGGFLRQERDLIELPGDVYCTSCEYKFTQKGGYCYG